MCFALYSTSRAFTKQYSILLEEMGITYPQYLTLMVLWQKDGILIQEIASNLEIEGATATPMVQRLEKLGLVTRVRSQEDERRVNVFLTEKGRSFYKKALSIPESLGCITGVDAKLARRLIDELNTIKLNMESEHEMTEKSPAKRRA